MPLTRHLPFHYTLLFITPINNTPIHQTILSLSLSLSYFKAHSQNQFCFCSSITVLKILISLKKKNKTQMKDEVIPTTIPSPSRTITLKKENSSDHAGLFGKTRYKFWALAAILLLAFWSMFTGSVNLKWSAANLARFSDHHHSLTHDDLDILVLNHCLCHSVLLLFF